MNIWISAWKKAYLSVWQVLAQRYLLLYPCGCGCVKYYLIDGVWKCAPCNCPCGEWLDYKTPKCLPKYICGRCDCGICVTVDKHVNKYPYCCECCFPGTGTVNLVGGKSVKMSELQIGDRVQTGKKSLAMSELQIGDRVQTGKKSVKMSELQIGD